MQVAPYSILLWLCCLLSIISFVNSSENEEIGVYQFLRKNGSKAVGAIPPEFINDRTIFDVSLLALAAQGDFGDGVVEGLIARGANVDNPHHGLCNPLHMAIYRAGHSSDADVPSAIKAIKALLAAGAQLATRHNGINALHAASIGSSQPAVFEFVLRLAPDLIESVSELDGKTPLEMCVESCNESKVRAILRAGAKPYVNRNIMKHFPRKHPVREIIDQAQDNSCDDSTRCAEKINGIYI